LEEVAVVKVEAVLLVLEVVADILEAAVAQKLMDSMLAVVVAPTIRVPIKTTRPRANEGDGLVIITFLGSANQPPEITQGAGPLTKTIDEDTNATWTASELNATDSDTGASSLAWSLLTSPSHGTATVSGNGSAPTSLSYQPNANYHGSDSFSVQVSDGENNDSITINLTINPVDEPFNGSFNWANHAGGK